MLLFLLTAAAPASDDVVLGMRWGIPPYESLGEELIVTKEIGGHLVQLSCHEPRELPKVSLGESLAYRRLCFWHDRLFEVEIHTQPSYAELYVDVLRSKYGPPTTQTSQLLRWDTEQVQLVVQGNRIRYQHRPTLRAISEHNRTSQDALRNLLIDSL